MKKRYLCLCACTALLMLMNAACTKDETSDLLSSGDADRETRAEITDSLVVELTEPGTLLEAIGDRDTVVQKLIVNGPINAVDVRTIRSLPELVAIDLKEATICGGDSTYAVYIHELWTGDGIIADVIEHYKLSDNEIGTRMFYNTELSEVVLPDNLVSIGSAAFYELGLTEINIPEGVQTIHSEAFYNCGLISVTLPSSLTVIEDYAFYSTGLRNLTLPESLTTLGNYAFSYSALREITVPESVQNIGSGCFSHCGSLVSVTLPDGQFTALPDACFRGCDALETIVLPASLETLGSSCFSECTSLWDVSLPDKLTAIGSSAFYQTRNLRNITLPESLTTIGDNAFERSALESVDIPDNVQSIGSGCFYDCGALSFVALPDGLTELQSEVFCDCYNLSTINIPSSLKSVGDYCFQNCDALQSLTFSSQLETIGEYSFFDCSALESIEFQSLKRIGISAFARSRLEHIVLSDNLETIDSRAFSYCPYLEVITIPQSVRSVGTNLFYAGFDNFQLYRSSLRAIIWNTSIPVPSTIVDEDIPSDVLLYVKDENVRVNTTRIKNVIAGGVAEELTLVSGDLSFYVPQPFKAMKCTYTQDFSYPTYPGASAGWQGISLPFTVEEITVDDGRVLAPFNANVPGAKPFWLRRLTAEGFEDVTQIEAYTPYIIAMPNNAAYDAEYNITGTVTFTAQDGAGIDIPATADMELVRDVGPDFALSCNFTYYPQNSPVYVLNRVDGENYYAGSRFVRNERAAYPFEACISSSALGIAPAYFPVDGGRPGTRTAKKALGPVPQVDDM